MTKGTAIGLAFGLAYLVGGCSLAFSQPPPSGAERGRERPHVECTTSIVPPIVDSAIGTAQLVRSGLTVAAADSVYRGSPISREVDLALGLGYAALFVGSAIYGFHSAARCSRVKNGEPSEGYQPGVSELPAPAPAPARLWSLPPAARHAAVAFSGLNESDKVPQSP